MRHTIKHHIQNKRTSKLPYPGYMDTDIDTSINMSGAGLGNWWRHKKMMWKFEKLMNKMRKGERKIEKYLLALDDFHTKYKLYDSKITAGNAELYNAMRINYIYKLQLKDIEDSKEEDGKKPLKSMISSNINKIETKITILKRELVVNFERNVKKDFVEFLKLGESLAPKLKKFNEYLEEIKKFNEKYKEEILYAEIADKTSVSVELGDFEDLKGEKSKSTQKIQSRVTKYRKDFDKIQNLNSDYFDKIFKGKSKAESLKSKIEQLKNHIDGMSLSKLKDNNKTYDDWKAMGEKFYEALSQFVSRKFVKSAETIKLNIGNIKRIYRETANPTIQTMVVPEFEKAEQNAKSAMEIYKTLTKEMGRIRNNFINFAKADELENDLSTLTESMMAATSRISSIVDFLKQYSTDGGSWKTYFSNISGGGIHMVGGNTFKNVLDDFGDPADGSNSFYIQYKKAIKEYKEKSKVSLNKAKALNFKENKLIEDNEREINLLDPLHAYEKDLIDEKEAEILTYRNNILENSKNYNNEISRIEFDHSRVKSIIINSIYEYLEKNYKIEYNTDNYNKKRYLGYFKRVSDRDGETNYTHSQSKAKLDLKTIAGYNPNQSYLIPIISDNSGLSNYYILVPNATITFHYGSKTDMSSLYIVYSSNINDIQILDFIHPDTGLSIIYYQVAGNSREDKKVPGSGGICSNNDKIFISQMCGRNAFSSTYMVNDNINMWDYFLNEQNNRVDPADSRSDCNRLKGIVEYFHTTSKEFATTRHEFINNIISQKENKLSKSREYVSARLELDTFTTAYKASIADKTHKPPNKLPDPPFDVETAVIDLRISRTISYEQNNDGSTGTSGGIGLGATGTTTTTYNEPNPEGERLTAQLTREVFGEIQKYEEDTQKEIGKFLKATKIGLPTKDQTPEALLNDISSYIKKLMLIEHEFKEFKEAKTVDQTMIGWDLQETMTNKNIDTDRSGIMELKSKLDTQYKDVLETDLNVYKDSNPLLYMRKFLQKQEPGSSALLDPAYFAKFLNEKSNLIKLTTGLNVKEAYDIECGITKVYEAFVKREKDTSNPNPITFGNDATYQYSMIQKAEECKKKKQNDKTKKENEKDRKAGYKATRDGYEAEDGYGDGKNKSKKSGSFKELKLKSSGGSRRTLKLSSKRRKTIKKRKPKHHIIKKH